MAGDRGAAAALAGGHGTRAETRPSHLGSGNRPGWIRRLHGRLVRRGPLAQQVARGLPPRAGGPAWKRVPQRGLVRPRVDGLRGCRRHGDLRLRPTRVLVGGAGHRGERRAHAPGGRRYVPGPPRGHESAVAWPGVRRGRGPRTPFQRRPAPGGPMGPHGRRRLRCAGPPHIDGGVDLARHELQDGIRLRRAACRDASVDAAGPRRAP